MFRILLMTLISNLALMLIGAGFDPNGLAYVGGMVLVLATIPVMVVMAALHGLETLLNLKPYVIAGFGAGFPAVAMGFLISSYGIDSASYGYAVAVGLMGLVWGAGWWATARSFRYDCLR